MARSDFEDWSDTIGKVLSSDVELLSPFSSRLESEVFELRGFEYESRKSVSWVKTVGRAHSCNFSTDTANLK